MVVVHLQFVTSPTPLAMQRHSMELAHELCHCTIFDFALFTDTHMSPSAVLETVKELPAAENATFVTVSAMLAHVILE